MKTLIIITLSFAMSIGAMAQTYITQIKTYGGTMKKLLLFSVIFLSFTHVGNAQYTTADISKIDKITWYGLDFSNVKLIGSIGFTNPESIQSHYFDTWNGLILSEPDKYNLTKYFHKDLVEHYLSVVTVRNTLPIPEELVIETEYSFGTEKVKQIIAEYDSGEREGIGLVFIIEKLNKYKEEANIWVTFFDIKTKEVLLTEYLEGKAGGFGFRNYWAKTYYNVMKSAYKSARKN